MLFIETLRRKKEILDKNGDKIMDLTKVTVSDLTFLGYKRSTIIAEDLQMRADLVARVFYGDSNKFDYVLKYNGISNPFSLYQGQLLLIPDENEMSAKFFDPKDVDSKDPKDVRNNILDPNKLSKKDAKRVDLIKKKAADLNAPSTTLLPPNMADPGSKEIKFKDGKIIFGEDVVGVNKANCPEPTSRALLKQKLLEKKIFGV